MNDINNWPAFIIDANVDPSTQQVSSPFADPYMTNPTEAQPDGSNTGLNPRDWASLDCAQQIATTLGGMVTTTRPPWAGGAFVGQWTANQPKFYVDLTPQIADPNSKNVIDPAYLANLFPGNKAELEQSIPSFLGITNQ